jgi:hypothetical protein
MITEGDNWTVRAPHSAFVLVSTSISRVSVFTYILEVTRKFGEGEEVGERGIKIKGKGGIY